MRNVLPRVPPGLDGNYCLFVYLYFCLSNNVLALLFKERIEFNLAEVITTIKPDANTQYVGKLSVKVTARITCL